MKKIITADQINQTFSLHDCFITSAKIEGDDVTFTFDDEVWLNQENQYNNTKNIVKKKLLLFLKNMTG